jgi:hypothetical protein
MPDQAADLSHYSRNELRTDAVVHVVGALFAITANLWLL